ncbi:hypothetical protein EGR_04380 [Echinococcus granulosus]|uniref:Uncharacterized protein n=1 Tax=Echinococcus granulosus TaxID=6210 RepID=W6V3W6_ECHGR|nr:hypothetical protein EGR_04380 [Echinococcus granulosus]EUB60754.1 hypothetical protein EGR_04380 [Echinococcus granulosus]
MSRKKHSKACVYIVVATNRRDVDWLYFKKHLKLIFFLANLPYSHETGTPALRKRLHKCTNKKSAMPLHSHDASVIKIMRRTKCYYPIADDSREGNVKCMNPPLHSINAAYYAIHHLNHR